MESPQISWCLKSILNARADKAEGAFNFCFIGVFEGIVEGFITDDSGALIRYVDVYG